MVPSSGASLTTREKGRKSGGGRERERQRDREAVINWQLYMCQKQLRNYVKR